MLYQKRNYHFHKFSWHWQKHNLHGNTCTNNQYIACTYIFVENCRLTGPVKHIFTWPLYAKNSTTKAIYLLKGLIERYQNKSRNLHVVLLTWLKEVTYDVIITSVKTHIGETNFSIRMILYQTSISGICSCNLVSDVLRY